MTIDPDLARGLFDTATKLADAARAAILPHFRGTGLVADNKQTTEFDPVTPADRAAERAMRDLLSRTRPNDAILGEEFGQQKGTSGLTWVLDPIDGTRAFLCGTPTWGVLIAVADVNGPILGIIDQPFTRERFVGGLGHAVWLGPDDRRMALQTRPTETLGQARLLTTFPEIGTSAERAAFQRVSEQVQLTRYGLDCYGYALLAAGQVDLVIEAGLQAYDIQAPIAVIEAAGGMVTNWEGGAAHEGGQVLAAANATLHAQALALLAAAG